MTDYRTADMWPAEKARQLRDLWAAGHSTSQIARQLGMTKNAVVGKANRLHLTSRPSPIAALMTAERREAIAAMLRRGERQYRIEQTFKIGNATIKSIRDELGIRAPEHWKRQPKLREPKLREPRVPALAALFPPRPRTPQNVIPFPITRGQCEWLEGDSLKTFVRCTNGAGRHRSWCPCHHKRVFAGYSREYVA